MVMGDSLFLPEDHMSAISAEIKWMDKVNSGRLAYEGYWKAGKFDGYGKLFNETPLHIEAFDYSNFNNIQ